MHSNILLNSGRFYMKMEIKNKATNHCFIYYQKLRQCFLLMLIDICILSNLQYLNNENYIIYYMPKDVCIIYYGTGNLSIYLLKLIE